MKRDYIICGYYTKNTPYEEEIKGLAQTCKQFDLKVHLQGYESRGSWVKNCAIKSEFVFECLQRFPDHNIVYIDADGKIKQYPKLFINLDVDIAVHYFKKTELISNTIFFQNIDKVKRLVQYWIDAQHLHPTTWDQKILQWCIEKYRELLKLNVMDLPPTYSKIFDLMAKCGDPVIEHYQASRRFKNLVNSDKTKIPELICGLKPRILDDGTMFLPRTSPHIEKLLDKDFCKIQGENRWYPRTQSGTPFIEVAKYFEGKECYIVGKGPSLDRLSASDFTNPEAPVIALNEAIHKVETLGLPNPLFVLQQDTWLKDSCKPSKEGTIMLLNNNCQHWYTTIRNKFIFHYGEIGLIKKQLSVIYAIAIAKTSKATALKLFAFDAAMTKETEYAKVVGYNATKGGDPKRFLSHRQSILRHAVPLPLEFIPVSQIASSSDILPQ